MIFSCGTIQSQTGDLYPRVSSKTCKTGERDMEAPGVLAALEQVMHLCPVGFHTSPAAAMPPGTASTSPGV